MPRTLLAPEQKLANKRESNRQWAERNKEKVSISQRKYEAANKAKIAASKAAARKADPETFKARTQRWREENPDHVRQYQARRYRENKDEARANLKAWAAANPARMAEVRAARRRSPDHAEWRRTYAVKRHAENLQARLGTLIRNRLRKALNGAKHGPTLDALGCSISELMAHMERQFQTGMSWANHGDWHIDHKRPLASFDLTDAAQYGQACHYSNLQPLWGRENQSKGSRYDQEANARAEEHRMD